MTSIDLLLQPGWIICVDEENRVLTGHSLAVDKGHIIDILPNELALSCYTPRDTEAMPGHALLPGFINTHTHAAMNLFRGLADDLPLMEWLQEHIWPAEQKTVSREFVRDGTRLAIAEMIRGGTTCFNDMYFFPDEVARVANELGMRASIGLIVIDFPTAWANDADEYISKGLQLHDHLRGNALVTTAFAPHAPYTVSDAPLVKILTLSEELDIPVHMHIHETRGEVEEAEKNTGKRPLQRLQELGALSPRLLAVHMTQLTDNEIDNLAMNGCHVLHCPESNLKLASGFCPVTKLQQAGINVTLGTDGASSNNDLDMLGEMRTAALLAKGVSGDPESVNAMTAIRMATINGACALGIEQQTGSLEPGKAADIIAIQLDTLESQPLYDPVSQVVYTAGRNQVTNVWIAGKQQLKNGKLTHQEESQLLDMAQAWQERIKNYKTS